VGVLFTENEHVHRVVSLYFVTPFPLAERIARGPWRRVMSP
jgi:hypothetical protein